MSQLALAGAFGRVCHQYCAAHYQFQQTVATLDCSFDSIFWDLDPGSKFLRQGSEMTLPRGSVRLCLRSALLTKEVLGAGLSQDCALSVTDPSQKAILEPFVRQVQVPSFAVIFDISITDKFVVPESSNRFFRDLQAKQRQRNFRRGVGLAIAFRRLSSPFSPSIGFKLFSF